MNYEFKNFSEEHRKPVIDILNYFIENSCTAVPDHHVSYEFFDTILRITDGYPRIAVHDNEKADKVAGFAYMRPYTLLKPMQEAYLRTAYLTYYLSLEYTRKGIGSNILTFFIREAEKRNIDSLLVEIAGQNEPSIKFHEKAGFSHCGRFVRAGRKFGKDLDIVLMQKLL